MNIWNLELQQILLPFIVLCASFALQLPALFGHQGTRLDCVLLRENWTQWEKIHRPWHCKREPLNSLLAWQVLLVSPDKNSYPGAHSVSTVSPNTGVASTSDANWTPTLLLSSSQETAERESGNKSTKDQVNHLIVAAYKWLGKGIYHDQADNAKIGTQDHTAVHLPVTKMCPDVQWDQMV